MAKATMSQQAMICCLILKKDNNSYHKKGIFIKTLNINGIMVLEEREVGV